MTYWSFGLTAVVTFFKGFDSFTPKFKSVSRFLQFLVAWDLFAYPAPVLLSTPASHVTFIT
jgi:hypothetical protein